MPYGKKKAPAKKMFKTCAGCKSKATCKCLGKK